MVSAGLVPCVTHQAGGDVMWCVTHQAGANHSLCANWVNWYQQHIPQNDAAEFKVLGLSHVHGSGNRWLSGNAEQSRQRKQSNTLRTRCSHFRSSVLWILRCLGQSGSRQEVCRMTNVWFSRFSAWAVITINAQHYKECLPVPVLSFLPEVKVYWNISKRNAYKPLFTSVGNQNSV